MSIEDTDLYLDTEPESSRAERRAEDLITPSFVTGSAGTGKTYQVQQRIAQNPTGITLAASTGIAAVNLGEGVTTIHSLLGFYDLDSIRDRYVTGRLTRRLEDLMRAGMTELACDEISMIEGPVLQMIHDAMVEAAERVARDKHSFQGCRLTLLGDFLQLPPVGKNAEWAFETPCWERVEPNITRLTKIWRQADPNFLQALAAARMGDGSQCAELLKLANVEFRPEIAKDFPGATIMGKNDQVDRFNLVELQKVQGRQFMIRNPRWIAEGAHEPNDWKNIPAEWPVKIGALVMLLANNHEAAGGELTYANGDLGIVRDWDQGHKTWAVELTRNGQLVHVGRMSRYHTVANLLPASEVALKNAGIVETLLGKDYTFEERWKMHLPMRTADGKKWIVGEVAYYPMRLAWASTCHRSQGLTLSAVQIDLRNAFMGESAMSYVALSRCRTPDGLRLVGTPETLARRLKVHEKARRWV